MGLLLAQLASIYFKLGIGIGIGWLLGKFSAPSLANRLGQGLFWVGVPVSVFAFVRQIDFTGSIWLAPGIAWIAMGLCLGVAWLRLKFFCHTLPKPSQGSFLLISTIGNTGYLGFPISLAIAGKETFGWALFYDLLGSLLWGYGIGVMVAAYYGQKEAIAPRKIIQKMLTQVAINPALWGLILGLLSRYFIFYPWVERSLEAIAWLVIMMAIILIGMRLSCLTPGKKNQFVWQGLTLKMLLVPLLFSLVLPLVGIPKPVCLALVLQMGMPPAFATLILSETYHLDQDLAVRALATGTTLLLITLPIWVFLLQ